MAVLLLTALLGTSGCGGDDPDPKAEASRATKTTTATTPAEPDVPQKTQPKGPSQLELAIDYQIKLHRFTKKYRKERHNLIKGFKQAKTPAAYITVAKKYKRYLNKAAHYLATSHPPRRVRPYHHRLIVIVRRLNGHMSLAIGGLKQLNLRKLNRFETLIDRDLDKGEKAADVIDDRIKALEG